MCLCAQAGAAVHTNPAALSPPHSQLSTVLASPTKLHCSRGTHGRLLVGGLGCTHRHAMLQWFGSLSACLPFQQCSAHQTTVTVCTAHLHSCACGAAGSTCGQRGDRECCDELGTAEGELWPPHAGGQPPTLRQPLTSHSPIQSYG